MAYTTIDDPSAHFHTQIWTGNSGFTVNVTNNAHSGDFQPDLIWAKDRVNAYNHDLVDSSRGPTVALHPNTTDAEYTRTQANYDFTSFDSNGFTTGAPDFTNSFGGNNNTNGKVAWQWKANGGTTASNTDGSITSTVQANQDAGFSIVTATAPSSNGHWSFGHGLGVKPDMVIQKSYTLGYDWLTWHKDLTNQTTYYLSLNGTAAEMNEASMWGGGMTSSVVGVSSPNSTIVNSPLIAYCFAEKQGYSKFGKYVGNGSTNGPFVYTGFKPAFLMMKESSSAGGNWVMFDNKRDPSNVTKTRLFPNLTNADNTTRNYVDLLSNGFKLRDTDADHNQSGQTMIYMAFAENPFVTSTGVPTTAR
jgi:hypothetical protein